MVANNLEGAGVRQRVTASDFQATMSTLDGLSRARAHLGKIRLFGPGEPFLHIILQMALIAFEREYIIGVTFDNRLGDSGLAAHRIDSDDAARDIQLLQ